MGTILQLLPYTAIIPRVAPGGIYVAPSIALVGAMNLSRYLLDLGPPKVNCDARSMGNIRILAFHIQA